MASFLLLQLAENLQTRYLALDFGGITLVGIAYLFVLGLPLSCVLLVLVIEDGNVSRGGGGLVLQGLAVSL